MDFTATKYSGQGSFTVKKEKIGKLLFLLKTIGIYSRESRHSKTGKKIGRKVAEF